MARGFPGWRLWCRSYRKWKGNVVFLGTCEKASLTFSEARSLSHPLLTVGSISSHTATLTGGNPQGPHQRIIFEQIMMASPSQPGLKFQTVVYQIRSKTPLVICQLSNPTSPVHRQSPPGGALSPALGSGKLRGRGQVFRPASLQPRLPDKVGSRWGVGVEGTHGFISRQNLGPSLSPVSTTHL